MRSPWTLNGRQDRLWRASNPEKQGTAMASLSVYVLNTIVTICCQLLVITCSALGAYKSSITFSESNGCSAIFLSTLSTQTQFKSRSTTMARLQPDNDAQHAQEEGLDSSSSNKPFPQRFTVVEHHPSGSSTVSQSSTGALHGTGSSSFTHAQGPTDSDRFSKNSRGMEERAKNELRDTLHWVSRMSGGPVDRKLLREAVGLPDILFFKCHNARSNHVILTAGQVAETQHLSRSDD